MCVVCACCPVEPLRDPIVCLQKSRISYGHIDKRERKRGCHDWHGPLTAHKAVPCCHLSKKKTTWGGLKNYDFFFLEIKK